LPALALQRARAVFLDLEDDVVMRVRFCCAASSFSSPAGAVRACNLVTPPLSLDHLAPIGSAA